MIIHGEIKKLREDLGDLNVGAMLSTEWAVIRFDSDSHMFSSTTALFYINLPVIGYFVLDQEATYQVLDLDPAINYGILGILEPYDVDICRKLINL